MSPTLGRTLRRAFTTSRKTHSSPPNAVYYEGPLHATVNCLRFYAFLHSKDPPHSFPSVHHTNISRELQLRTRRLGGMVNFSWLSQSSVTEDVQSATVYSPLGGRLNIPNVSLENIDNVVQSIAKFIEGPLTPETSDSVDVYVCTHAARDCRCGERGQEVYRALVDSVEAEKERDPAGLASRIRVAETGHVGGHKYAANLLVFPHGEWLGCIKPGDANWLVSRLCRDIGSECGVKPLSASDAPLSIRHWRGRMDMTMEEQQGLYQRFVPGDQS